MASFSSILTSIGNGLKKFFGNPIVQDVEKVAIPLAETFFPAITPLVNGVLAAAGKAETLALAAGAQSGTGVQKLALALQDAEIVFQTYEAAQGVKITTDSKTTIINSIVAILNALPSSTI